MKNLYSIILFLAVTLSMSAQTPEKISYQAIIRADNNSFVANSNVSVRIIIRQGTITGTIVYQETHSATTNTKS